MPDRGERANAVADDLEDREHGHGERRARNAPHPIPEDERADHQYRIEREAPRQQVGRDPFALEDVDDEIGGGWDERLPQRVEAQEADDEEEGDARQRTEDEHIVE